MSLTGAFIRRAVFVLACVMLVQAATFGASLRQGLFHIEYPEGMDELAEETADVMQDALIEYADRLHAGDEPITVVICGALHEFQLEAGFFAQPSVSGVARSEEGRIAVKAPGLLDDPSQYAPTLRHELVHVLLARTTNLDNLPRWLNEGIAMTKAREHRFNSSYRVAQMYMGNRLIRYPDLVMRLVDPGRELPFGDAYAQSLSMTRYLQDRLGEDAFWDLVYDLRTMRFGQALGARLGMTPAEFWEAWRGSLWKVALFSSLMSGFTLFQLMAVLTVVAYVRKRRRGQAIMRAWEEEEAEGPPFISVWDLERDSEYPWEMEDEDDR